MIREKKYIKRKCRQSIFVPGQCTNLRMIIDRMLDGKAINEQVRTSTPLTPDGEVDDDFNTGTRELLDMVDYQEVAEEVEQARKKHEERVAKEKAERHQKEIDALVDAEVKKRLNIIHQSDSDPDVTK